MNWITITWPMVAAACLTLGLIELSIGLVQQPQRAARLLFALGAFAMAASAGVELALVHVGTIPNAELLLGARRVTHSVIIAALTGFVWFYYGTGNKRLALTVIFLCLIGLVVGVVSGQLSPYNLSVTGLRSVEVIGGVTITVIDRVFNPWNTSLYFAALAAIVFVADASVRLWRRGGRRRALAIGGSITFFILAASVHTALVSRGLVHTPNMVSWVYLSILVAMAIELNADVLGAVRLAGQLKESERRMDLASAAANLGLWAWNMVDDTIWATSRARVLFGFSESERIDFARFQSALHPEDREAMERSVESALSSGHGYEAEYRVCLPEGQVRWLAARGQVEHDAKGKPIRMRGVVIDVTARRGDEFELQQLRSQLAHASRVSMLGQLASALAHELSQPLGAILRNTEAAELFLEHEPPDLDELRAILADIRHDDQRAGGVIDRLRALLKRRSFAPQALSVNDELANVAALARSDSATRKVALEIDAAPDLPPVMGDPVHLQQVLLNLILNAMDAVEDEAVTRRKVRVSARRNGEDEIEVAVEDSGVGIAPERLVRLFEPFFTTKANGMGIGLSISRTIVEAHGGHLWAENNAVAGATFRFTLPLAGAATPS